MTQTEKFNQAIQLLKETNCPAPIMDALWLFGLTVHNDEVKLHNWQAISEGNLVEGEVIEGKLLPEGRQE